ETSVSDFLETENQPENQNIRFLSPQLYESEWYRIQQENGVACQSNYVNTICLFLEQARRAGWQL
ncbi:MAG: hypothetical protein ACTS3T_16010, partial [Almyronema sp.]